VSLIGINTHDGTTVEPIIRSHLRAELKFKAGKSESPMIEIRFKIPRGRQSRPLAHSQEMTLCLHALIIRLMQPRRREGRRRDSAPEMAPYWVIRDARTGRRR
jgi:hypothetical protein